MTRDFFDPTPEQQNIVLINTAVLPKAERQIESCEHCNPEGAEIPFDAILDRVRFKNANGGEFTSAIVVLFSSKPCSHNEKNPSSHNDTVPNARAYL